MKRRAFLGGALAFLGARRLAFADVAVAPSEIALGPGPTLVIINPADAATKHTWGRVIGGVLWSAGDDLLARLDGVQVLVAPWATLAKLAAGPEPLVVYVDARRDLVVHRIDYQDSDDKTAARIDARLREILPRAGGDVAARAKRVRARILEQRIPGSHWASDTGCGVHVDGLEGPLHKCGMGHVPKTAARFLWLFTTAPD